jgi:hypothetical protein
VEAIRPGKDVWAATSTSAMARPDALEEASDEEAVADAREAPLGAGLRDPARARARIAERAASFGVPREGFEGQVDLHQAGRPRLSWAMGRIDTPRERAALEANLAATRDVFPDTALLLAVTMRERPSAWTARGLERIETYHEGGLDHLGSDLPRLRGLVPEATRRRWEATEAYRSFENGRSSTVRPATLPARDQLVAYAATLRLREQRFEQHVRSVFGERADALLASASPGARRAWIQATFGRPGVTRYDAATGSFQRNASGRELVSAHAGLERIAAEAEARGEAPSLDAIFTDPLLRRHATFQRARITALEAQLLADEVVAPLARAASVEVAP